MRTLFIFLLSAFFCIHFSRAATIEGKASLTGKITAKEDAQHITRQATNSEQRAAEAAKDTYLETGTLPAILANGEVLNVCE